MGARGNSTLRRYLGSVSSQVVAQSECSVTVVRVAPGGPARANDPQAQAGAPPHPGRAPQPRDTAAPAVPPRDAHVESRSSWDPSSRPPKP
jgi:Universal stress protein family